MTAVQTGQSGGQVRLRLFLNVAKCRHLAPPMQGLTMFSLGVVR